MTMLTRYTDDPNTPAIREWARDVLVRAVLPAVALFAAIVGVGMLIVGPLGSIPGEDDINRVAQSVRTPTWDEVTALWSRIGNTEIVIGVCVLAVAVLWWRTRQWWYAVIPALAISLQASVFVPATALTGRQRPHLEHLDPAPPTSSYPSGHMGASTALYLTFAVMAQRIDRAWLRRLVTTICLVVPVLVGYARVYRGMHHVTDVVVGGINGLVCAFLAWRALRRRPAGKDTDTRPADSAPAAATDAHLGDVRGEGADPRGIPSAEPAR